MMAMPASVSRRVEGSGLEVDGPGPVLVVAWIEKKPMAAFPEPPGPSTVSIANIAESVGMKWHGRSWGSVESQKPRVPLPVRSSPSKSWPASFGPHWGMPSR